MQINRTDVLWNYAATFFKIAASAILLPLILNVLPSQDVGIWAIFSSIAALVFLLDFGFNSSFARNIVYVFSGIQTLQTKGFQVHFDASLGVNYGLLSAVLAAMRWFYLRVASILLILLFTVGTWYFVRILEGYQGDKTEIIVAWILFCLINCYNLYTLYYDALLEGKGLIKTAKKITVFGNVIYLIIGASLVRIGFGLVSLVLAQLLSIVIIRVLSYKVFFTRDILEKIVNTDSSSRNVVLSAIYPNAFKYGLTSLGGFMIQKSAVFIGSLFITLSAIASFGITKQIIDILVAVANITLVTYLPQITKLRVEGNLDRVKRIYIKGILISNVIFLIGALSIILFGRLILDLLGSNTTIVPINVILAMCFSSFIGLNAGISGAVISTKNEIPFMKPSLYSGLATIVSLLVIFKFTDLGILGMALVPGLIDLCYQGWKWPYVVIKELKINMSDIKDVVVTTLRQIIKKS